MTIHEPHPSPLMKSKSGEAEELRSIKDYVERIQFDLKYAHDYKEELPINSVLWRLAHAVNRMKELEERL